MELDNWQKEFLECKGDKILCSGRQCGKSQVCSVDAIEYGIRNPKSAPIVIIAPTERQAYGLFCKCIEYVSMKYPKKLVTKGKDKPTKQKFKLLGGPWYYCLPVGLSGLGIRFLTVGRLYADECSRIPEEVFTAIGPACLTTGAAKIFLSTPNGAQGTFYRCFINENSAWNSFTRFSVDSETVIRDRKVCPSWTQYQKDAALLQLEQDKARMSKREYAQEYLGRFESAFNRFFSDELITKTCVLKRRETIIPNRKYFLGCDIARMGEDELTYETMDKIDRDTIEHVDSLVKRKQLTTVTEDDILSLNVMYNYFKIGLDAGSGTLGVSILDHLLRHDATRNKVVALNNREIVTDRDDKEHQRLMKEDMYNNLLALMEQGKIKLLNDDEVIASLRAAMYEYVMEYDRPTRMRVFSNYGHITEGLVRAAWLCTEDKRLNLWCG